MCFGNPAAYIECVVAGCWIALVLFPGANTARFQEQFAVAYAGDTIKLTNYSALCHSMCSGYLLQDPVGPASLRPAVAELEAMPSARTTM